MPDVTMDGSLFSVAWLGDEGVGDNSHSSPPSEILLVYKELSSMVAKVWQAAIPSRYVLERTSNQGNMTLPMTRARAAGSLYDHMCSGDRGHPQVWQSLQKF